MTTHAAEVVKILREEAVHIADHYSTLPAETMNEAAYLIEAQDRVVRALEEIREVVKGPLSWSPAEARRKRVAIYNIAHLALADLPSRSRG